MKSGGIIFLQNCHLARSFMPVIEKKLELLNSPDFSSEVNVNFRMFLTSAPVDYLPHTIILNTMKITNEPAQGIKNNMGKIWSGVDQEQMTMNLKKEHATF